MSRVIIVINTQLCNGCGICIELCPSAVFTLHNGEIKVVNEDNCIYCLGCIALCPKKAIKIKFSEEWIKTWKCVERTKTLNSFVKAKKRYR